MSSKYQLFIQYLAKMAKLNKWGWISLIEIKDYICLLLNIIELENTTSIRSELQDYLITDFFEYENGICTIQFISEDKQRNCLVSFPSVPELHRREPSIVMIYTQGREESVKATFEVRQLEQLHTLLIKLLS